MDFWLLVPTWTGTSLTHCSSIGSNGSWRTDQQAMTPDYPHSTGRRDSNLAELYKAGRVST